MNAVETSFRDVAGRNGIFTDGDWVESKDQDQNGDVRLIQLADVGVGTYRNRSARFMTKSKAEELKCTFLKPGDLLVARMPDPLGRACIFPGDPRPCVTVVDVCLVRPDPTVADVRWLNHVVNAPSFRAQLMRFVKGTTRQRISRKNLESVSLPLPPLEEQRRIAAILDKADAIRSKRQQAIDLTNELLRSTFSEMFGDPVGNPKGWTKKPLGELAPDKGLIVDGPFGSSLKPELYVEEGIRVIRNFNITDDHFNAGAFKYVTEEKFHELSRSEVAGGDVLVSTKGTVGNVCVMPDDYAPGLLSASGTVRIRMPDGAALSPHFVVAQMIQPNFKCYLKRFESGTNQRYLNLSAIRKLELIVPPGDEQQQFLEIRKRILNTKDMLLQAAAAGEELFCSLVQRVFRGQLS